MRDKSVEQKLTPAARKALDELVEDYKDQILISAEQSASRLTGELLHDIFVGINKSQTRSSEASPSVFEKLLNLYIVFGLLVAAGGLLFFSIKDFLVKLDLRAQLPP